MPTTLYDILGVSSKASLEEIKSAYKKLAKKHHPDKNPGDTWHEEQFKRISQAYQIISNPVKRNQYDGRLEYEAYLRQNPRPTPRPQTTQTSQTTQKKEPTQQKREPQKSKPYSPFQEPEDPKFYNIKLSNKNVNLLVVSYYVIAITLMGLFYEYQDYLKIQYFLAEAEQHEKDRNFEYAISAYSRIILIDDNNSKALEKRGICYQKINDYNHALKDFSKAIKSQFNPPDSLIFRHAQCLFYTGNYEASINDLNDIIKNKKSINDSVYYFKAENNFLLNLHSNAIQDYSKFISIKPTSGEAHYKRGICYLTIKDYKNALPDYTFTIKWQPENGENYYQRGLINFALKDSTNGCKDLHDSFLLGFTESLEAKEKYCGAYLDEDSLSYY